MAVIEQPIALTTTDGSGNSVIYYPLTNVDQVEGAVKTINGQTPDEDGNIALDGISDVGALPIGFIFFTINPNDIDGTVELNGYMVDRETYANLYEWALTQPNLVTTEEDWQAKKALSPNNVPYFSTGDGSTTFRLPMLNGYVVAASPTGDVELRGRYCIVAFNTVTNAGNLELASILTAVNNATQTVAELSARVDKYSFNSLGDARERNSNKPSYGLE